MRITEIFENSDDMFGAPRDDLGKAIRSGNWQAAAKSCLARGIKNPSVEKNIIPGIVKSEGFKGTWYVVKDWYEKFISPAPWPELIQYVSALNTKSTVDAALTNLCYFYINASPDNASVVKQLILNKKDKAANAALAFINRYSGYTPRNQDYPRIDTHTNHNLPRWPEMEPYIMTSPRAAMYYAAGVLHSRWPEAEPYIATDKVSWSMYAARSLGTNNGTRAGRETRDAAQQDALRRLPDGHKKRIAEEDDMFAPSFKRIEKWSEWFNACGGESMSTALVSDFIPGELRLRLKELGLAPMGYFDYDARNVKGIYYVQAGFGTITNREYTTFQDYLARDPNFIKLSTQVNEEDEMFSNERPRQVAQRVVDLMTGNHSIEDLEDSPEPFRTAMYHLGYEDMDGTDWWDRVMDEINNLNESEDDMFAPSARTRAQQAIKAVLDSNYDRFAAHYNEIDPDQTGADDWLTRYGEFMSDYDYLRGELARGGVKGFLNALDMVGQDVINTIDADLAIMHKVYLSDLENQYGLLDESNDDDMFAPSNRIVNPRPLANICHRLSVRYAKYAGTSEGDTQEMYINDSQALRRAANAFQSGVRAGLKELEDVEDSSTWEDLADYAERDGIDIQELCDRYDAGELDESADDELFATRSRPDLRKISSAQLSMLYTLAKSDSRAEYASAHKLQMARIEAEMARRGHPIRSLAEQANISIGSRKGK